MTSTKVKICGLTNFEDSQVAVNAGADALGFVFYKKSPRYVDPKIVKTIIHELPPFILTVGVFVNEEALDVKSIMAECGLSLVQLHGDETPAYCTTLNYPILRGIRLRDRGNFLAMAEYKGRARVRAFMVDAFSESAFGGTGERADWNLAAEAAQSSSIFLAGGLTPENVQEAIQKVRPYGVDVSSGVEDSPGKKNHAKIMAFVRTVKLVS